MKDNSRFRHESLQDQETIQGLLKALSKGIAKGEVHFSDDNGEIVMNPEGLLHVKLVASEDDGHNRINLRISWRDDNHVPEKSDLKIGK